MSKHLIEINFDQLSYNLYNLLNVKNKCSEKSIKKAYRKLIISYHPDKIGENYDEEIYNHLTIANQVLTNDVLRKKYDDWLESFEVEKSHEDLKSNYLNNYDPKTEVKHDKSFGDFSQELNLKHGFSGNDDFLTAEDLSKKVKDYQNQKDNVDFKISFEEISDNSDFNNRFSNRKDDGTLEKQLIKIDNKEVMEINKSEIGDNYLSISNYGLLYSNDGVDTDSYASVNGGFNLLPNLKSERVNNSSNRVKNFRNTVDEYKNEGVAIQKSVNTTNKNK